MVIGAVISDSVRCMAAYTYCARIPDSRLWEETTLHLKRIQMSIQLTQIML